MLKIIAAEVCLMLMLLAGSFVASREVDVNMSVPAYAIRFLFLFTRLDSLRSKRRGRKQLAYLLPVGQLIFPA